MKHKFITTILLILTVSSSVIAQIALAGTTVDLKKQTALPFVNIGIRIKNVGTTSLPDGTFSLTIPQQNENDTLTFSMVGYSELNAAVKDILNENKKIFSLKAKTVELNEVKISEKKLVEKKFGIKNDKALIHFTDGSTNQNDIFEIAQLIKLRSSTLSKITSVNLHINETRTDSGMFRINFYGFDGSRPTNRIIEKSIVQIHQIKEGWLKFDLSPYNIYLKENFVVAIEFIPTGKKNNQIYYEVKLGGSSRSFVRASSQGEWVVPPHHYRLFVTALVADSKNKQLQDDIEEKESAPDTVLFSEFVKDSFSVFISLPKDYEKKKNKKFNVIFLLDANVYFDIVAREMNEKKITDAILVGVGYKDFIQMDSLRNRDYTFPMALPQDSFPISGGAAKFLSFIEEELVPFIDKNYRCKTTNRTLMGHSLGGYFILYALNEEIKSKSNFFKNYIAASPSLNYCNDYIATQFQNTNSSNNTNELNLFLTFGAREDSEDGDTGTTGITSFNALDKLLTEDRFKNIKIKSEIYPTYGHMETAIPTFTNAIKKIE